MTRAAEDGTTVRIYYESRLAKLELSEEMKPKIDGEYEEITEHQEQTMRDKLKTKWAKLEAIVGAKERVRQIARDIVNHFEKREQAQENAGGKAMIVAMSCRIAVDLYRKLLLSALLGTASERMQAITKTMNLILELSEKQLYSVGH